MMTKYAKPTPPQGYATWLDYAVHNCDLRALELRLSFEIDDPQRPWERMPLRVALEEELRELRGRAGVPDTYPTSVGRG